MNIVLIGYRGTGKSTVARILAERLGWRWIDADEQIERASGKTIRQIFAESGEAGFRQRESAVIERLCRGDSQVLALGGGAVLRSENRQVLSRAGKVIWLQADPATIEQRIAADPATGERRPNLTASGGLPEIVELLEQRKSLYRQVADLQLSTEGKTPEEVADRILELLEGEAVC